ncbi:MAG: hypothetical protein KME26_26690 [Oscillatoria princeps RMCB-10]|nr:hypothetical protein [Oscillatoria princeps RMCB-10]
MANLQKPLFPKLAFFTAVRFSAGISGPTPGVPVRRLQLGFSPRLQLGFSPTPGCRPGWNYPCPTPAAAIPNSTRLTAPVQTDWISPVPAQASLSHPLLSCPVDYL